MNNANNTREKIETRTVQDLIDAYIEKKIRLENWENLSIRESIFQKISPDTCTLSKFSGTRTRVDSTPLQY
jgi:hypothetical protein